MKFSWQCKEEDEGRQLRHILAQDVGFSSRLIKKVRLYGQVFVNGIFYRMIDSVPASADILILLPEPQDSTPLLATSGIDIIYHDAWYVVVNKRHGQLVHPSISHKGDTVTELLAHSPLHPVNRLDKDTTGLVLIARLAFAHYYTVSNPMEKIYLGIVHGRMPGGKGTISAPITRSQDSYIERTIDDSGKESITHYQELSHTADDKYSLVEFRLETGRTHQIRLHCQWSNNPLVGETLYGDNTAPSKILNNLMPRQALHAYKLSFYHVEERIRKTFTAPLPQDMADFAHRVSLPLEIIRHQNDAGL